MSNNIIKTFKNFLSTEECDFILNKCKEELTLKAAEVYVANSNDRYDTKIRKSSIGWISDLGFLNERLTSKLRETFNINGMEVTGLGDFQFTEYKEEIKSIKQITKLDKERLAYKPEKGQNQWSRNCQNSGDNKVRRPEPYTNIDQIIKLGYEFNSNTGDYERIIKSKNGKTTVLKAAKITNFFLSLVIMYAFGYGSASILILLYRYSALHSVNSCKVISLSASTRLLK